MDLEDLLLTRLVSFIPVLLSLAVHEWAHAWSAQRLGDDTAARLGRLTVNPFAHVDPVGTLLLPLLGVPFGWAKPVPVNPVRFRRGIRMGVGLLLVAAAGPASNVCLAVLCAALILALYGGVPTSAPDPAAALLSSMVLVNVALAVFNLLPVPPLDGSRIVDGFLPRRWRPAWEAFSRVSPILLLVAIFCLYLIGIGLFGEIEAWIQDILERLSF